ncbi:HNH endonuclease [Listeria cossartiae subsp. cayugensis]|nr:HNH endonuclease [Listeria cossartiae subsp. cayugensis]
MPLRDDIIKAYDLSNLETICPSCHGQLHPERNAKIGYKKREQKQILLCFIKTKNNPPSL